MVKHIMIKTFKMVDFVNERIKQKQQFDSYSIRCNGISFLDTRPQNKQKPLADRQWLILKMKKNCIKTCQLTQRNRDILWNLYKSNDSPIT